MEEFRNNETMRDYIANTAPRRRVGNHEDNSASIRQDSTKLKRSEDINSTNFPKKNANSTKPLELNAKLPVKSNHRNERVFDLFFNKITGSRTPMVESSDEDISKTISDLNRNLSDLDKTVSSYLGPKSDKMFFYLKAELNKIWKIASHLRQNNIYEDFMAEITMLLTRTEHILNKLNNRSNDFEEENDNHVIRQIKEQIVVIHKDIAENPKTIDELNRCKRILKSYAFSLDNINTKDRPTVKGNYEETVRQVYAILKILNEKAKSLTHVVESKNGCPMDFPDIALDHQTFGCNQFFNRIMYSLKQERINAVNNYKKRMMQNTGASEEFLENLKLTHASAKESCKIEYLAFTSTLNALTVKNVKKFNIEVDIGLKALEKSNKDVPLTNLKKINSRVFADMSASNQSYVVEIESKTGSPMDFPNNALDKQMFGNDEILDHITQILKQELKNAVKMYKEHMKQNNGASQQFLQNLEHTHASVKESCKIEFLWFTSKLHELTDITMKDFNHEVDSALKDFEKSNTDLTLTNVKEIKSSTFADLSREQKNISKFSTQAKGPNYAQLPHKYQLVASKQNEVPKQHSFISANSNSENHSYKIQDNKKGIISYSNQAEADEIQKMKSRFAFGSLFEKLGGDDTSINYSLLTKNNKLREHEQERYEKCLNQSRAYYNKELNDKIVLLGYSPEPEKIDQFHTKVLSKTLIVLKNECSNLNITLEGKNMEKELEELIAQDLKILKENVAVRRYPVRNIKMSVSNLCSYAIGIDLGTSFSSVTVFKNNKFEVLKTFQELRRMPSVVYIGSEKPSVGYEALKKGMADPSNLICGVKQIMGRSFNEPEVKAFISSSFCKINTDNGGVTICSSNNYHFKPEEIAAEILKEMKRIAEYHLKNPVNNVVVTIPAFFTDPQRRATLGACKLAGLNVLRLLNEPTAAALAYVYHFQDDGSKNVLVFDFGGGTFDVSVLEINGNNLNVKASFGNNYLGGQDFDQNLMNYLLRKLKSEKDISINNHIKMRIFKECEQVKKHLSENETAKIKMPQIHDGLDSEVEITRSTFENLNKELFDKALETVTKCIENAGLTKNQIDEIVLTGGSSHIPKIQQMLHEYFKDDKVRNKINSEEATSYGAALQAAILTGECKNDFKISDVIPHSLGIQLQNNEYGKIIIRKNTKLPCKGSLRTTVCGNQEQIRINIIHGENPVASYNTCLDSFTKFLTPRTAGDTELNTTFEIDENGILTVTLVEIQK